MEPISERGAWRAFKRHRRGYFSLLLLAFLFSASLLAPLWSNDKPLWLSYRGESYFPLLHTYHDRDFGGDFDTPADYLDPLIRRNLSSDGNRAVYPPNPYAADTLNDFDTVPDPAAPSERHLLGTDDRGRDVLARLVYGFRDSLLFALVLTAVTTVIGVAVGAVQGYFGGKTDLVMQRFIEIWGGMPELYLLIILSSFFNPGLLVLLALLSLFGWMGLSDYVRAEFLKNRQADYVLAARAMGVGGGAIMWRHILPNSLTPVLAFLPFRISGAVLALTSLDFLGLGVAAAGDDRRGAAPCFRRAGKEGLMEPYILEVENLTAAFGSREVLSGIGCKIRRGRKTAVVGESGSGKTVFAQSIMRLNPDLALKGRLNFDGEDVLQAAPRRLRQLRGSKIGMVFQEPMTALNPVMTVGAQIAEVLTLHLGLDKKQAWARAVGLLAETGIGEPEAKAAAYPFQLSGGQRQRAMIAMAVAAEPELLIADEPTTALDVAVQAQILDLLFRLQQTRNMTLLYITHDLNLVRRFADDIIVMKQGRVVEQGAAAEVFAAPRHDYTKLLLDAAPRRDVRSVAGDSPFVIEADGIAVSVREKSGWFSSRRKTLLEPLSLQLKAGETLGIIGESGSGKTTLAKALMRLIEAEGRLKIRGREWRREMRREIQMVFQDPFGAFNPRMKVSGIVSEGLRVHEPRLDKETVRQRVAEVLRQVGLPEDASERYPHEFSGGQRQRLAVARALIVKPSVLVLDEPTSALDVQWQRQILKLLADLQREYGLSMVIVSHDLAVINALSHRVMVIRNGKVVEQGDCETVFRRPQHEYTKQLLAHYGNDGGLQN